MSTQKPQVESKVRVKRGEDIAVGPGKIELLKAIGEAGSISGAARTMGMSYRRAWLLVETMNSCFVSPLVATATGGKSGGGAQLTDEGRKVLNDYADLMADIDAVAARYLETLQQNNPLA